MILRAKPPITTFLRSPAVHLDVIVLIVSDMCDKFLLPTLFTCKLVFFYMGDYKELSLFNLIIRRKIIL